jgi:hypothetical protein
MIYYLLAAIFIGIISIIVIIMEFTMNCLPIKNNNESNIQIV